MLRKVITAWLQLMLVLLALYLAGKAVVHLGKVVEETTQDLLGDEWLGVLAFTMQNLEQVYELANFLLTYVLGWIPGRGPGCRSGVSLLLSAFLRDLRVLCERPHLSPLW